MSCAHRARICSDKRRVPPRDLQGEPGHIAPLPPSASLQQVSTRWMHSINMLAHDCPGLFHVGICHAYSVEIHEHPTNEARRQPFFSRAMACGGRNQPFEARVVSTVSLQDLRRGDRCGPR